MKGYRMRIRTLLGIASLTLSATSAGGSPGKDAGEELVERFVADVETLSGRVEQRLIDANGDVIEVSSGTLDIERPGRFRWAYAEPYEQLLVADGRNVWSYDVDLAQVTVKPQDEALANTPALLLGGSADVMREFDYDGSYENGGMTWARLVPIGADSGFKRVELAFDDAQLTRMVFLDNLEQTTIVSLYDVEVNASIDPYRFRFTVPDDADLVGTPRAAGAAPEDSD